VEYEPDPGHVADLATAWNALDQAIRILVTDELKHRIPGFEQREASAADDLRIANLALEGPQADLDQVTADIERARGEAAVWDAALHSGDMSERVSARAWFISWNEELSGLEAKRDELERVIEPLLKAKDQAKDQLALAGDERLALEINCHPESAYFMHGLDTSAYKSFRVGFGHLALILAAADPDHPEWAAGMEWLQSLAEKTGHTLVPLDDSLQTRRFWDDFTSAHVTPAKSGGVVHGESVAELANVALNVTPG
jgi:hypothetical protein